MPDYKELYERVYRATEKAMRILIDAQQECEEQYLLSETEMIVLLERGRDKDNRAEETKNIDSP